MAFKPLIAICGTTGVGKSKLAIELALKLAGAGGRWRNARVINADSMQVYAGMDIITNKVPEHEMQGVDHLLMGFKEPGDQYVVGQWVRDAMKAIDETHKMGQVPIVVGGTAYWMQHLIFPDRLMAKADRTQPTPLSESVKTSLSLLTPELRDLFYTLPLNQPVPAPEPEEAFTRHRLLTALDPTVAARWHWKDTRKVLRSLQIIHETGKTAGELCIEQSQNVVTPRYPTLCLWLYADPLVLNGRLDDRVDDMVKLGLLDEVTQLRDLIRQSSVEPDSSPLKPDYTLGIFQSIGFREFDAYLDQEKTYKQAIDEMKTSTRQYARLQVGWLRRKLLPAIYASQAIQKADSKTHAYLLDATELGEHWDDNVLNPAYRITQSFLGRKTMPDPLGLSDAARVMLQDEARPTLPTDILAARKLKSCELCTINPAQPKMVEEGQMWAAHLKSKGHKALLFKANGYGRDPEKENALRKMREERRSGKVPEQVVER